MKKRQAGPCLCEIGFLESPSAFSTSQMSLRQTTATENSIQPSRGRNSSMKKPQQLKINAPFRQAPLCPWPRLCKASTRKTHTPVFAALTRKSRPSSTSHRELLRKGRTAESRFQSVRRPMEDRSQARMPSYPTASLSREEWNRNSKRSQFPNTLTKRMNKFSKR